MLNSDFVNFWMLNALPTITNDESQFSPRRHRENIGTKGTKSITYYQKVMTNQRM